MLLQVPSHFYSFSFALKSDWSQVYARQPEIRAYFRQIADQHDIPSRVVFGSQVLGAEWDESTATWVVHIENLDSNTRYDKRCRVLISAIGALSIPKKCDIPGVGSFKGQVFHSAEWDHTFDWKAKKVGTCISGFPNFFMMMGPNTVTGHLSVIYTVECQINFTMRIIKPILKSMQSPQAVLRTRSPVDKVVVSATSQRRDNDWIQEKAKELVWATGCTSWFIDPQTGRITQMYPDWQYKF